jgi:hypothetical protein
LRPSDALQTRDLAINISGREGQIDRGQIYGKNHFASQRLTLMYIISMRSVSAPKDNRHPMVTLYTLPEHIALRDNIILVCDRYRSYAPLLLRGAALSQAAFRLNSYRACRRRRAAFSVAIADGPLI